VNSGTGCPSDHRKPAAVPLYLHRRQKLAFPRQEGHSICQRNLESPLSSFTASDESAYGYLSEHHSFGETDDRSGEYAEDLAATMLATTLRVEFDPSVDWDGREKYYKMSGKILKTFNITLSAEGDKDGRSASVVAMAVLLP